MKIAKWASSLALLSILCSFPLASRHLHPPGGIEAKIDQLLAQMTLEEKLGQLQQLDGHADGRYREEHPDLVRRGLVGSFLNVRGARRTNELQRFAVEESRLKIPLLFAFDVIHGYRTIFPVPLAEAASWDPQGVERAAAVAAAEAAASGLHWTFAPMVDVSRDPRWGRIVESAGEDPYLGSVMAAARVRGFQGQDYSAPDKIVACAKHWVAYGAAEGGRDYNTTDLSERTLREIYFPPFQAALEAGVATFMSAFNDLNGTPATANPFTLKKVLRQEWGFDGFVVSDYTSVQELIAHGLAADSRQAALAALTAGVDMEMVSRLYAAEIPELLRLGKLTAADIDESVRRILRIKFRLGLFDHPYVDESREPEVLLHPDHLAKARKMAARSMVLLKNEGELLPLPPSLHSIAVIGSLADDKDVLLGSWRGDGRPADAVSILEGIRAKLAPSVRLLHAKGCDIDCGSSDRFREAVEAARQAEVAILVLGESAEMSGEAASRAYLDLPGRQLDLLKAVHATGTPTVLVLMNGRPLTINWAAENVAAILEAWFPGTQGGNAVADVLFGDFNPGGKLPVTFPRAVGQIPLYYNHKNTGRPPGEQKYTSKYLDVPATPLFPFGHGLSYTRFRLSNLQLSEPAIPTDGRLFVNVEVENTGKRSGEEVVQLYLTDMAASVTRPVRELKGFERIFLEPGERKRVDFTLEAKDLGFYDRDMQFVVEPGQFKIAAGTSSVGGLEAFFEVFQGKGQSASKETPAQNSEAFLEEVQRRTFRWFWEWTDPATGLTPDRTPKPPFSSIAAVGFALTAYPVGAERGYISRAEAAERVLSTLRFFAGAPQGPEAEGVTGYRGFFYHFLNLKTGHRHQKTELSTIDTALLMAGVLFCQSYFDGTPPIEAEIRRLAESLYRRVEWDWIQPRAPLIAMAWRPESGFGDHDYQGYDEAMILYLLALGSPTHAVKADAWREFTSTYRWEDFYGQKHVNFSPLFGHQYSHVWADFRGIQDAYMREKGIDYFENSRRATYSNRAYCSDNPMGWKDYGENVWGLTACDGPNNLETVLSGKKVRFRRYWARGASRGDIRDDGTIAPTAAGGSVPFAPEITIPALEAMSKRYGDRLFNEYGFLDAFNPSFNFAGAVPEKGHVDPQFGWFDSDQLGIDQGPILLMIENHRSGLIWKVMRKNPHLVRALCRAGFSGGWLEGRCGEDLK